MSERIPIMRTEHLTKILINESHPVTLVKDINMKIYSGECLVITGASGSGKSSLIYLLGLLDAPTSGTIYLENQNVQKLTSAQQSRLRLEKMGFVFQFHFLISEFSVLDNVLLPIRKLNKLTETQAKEKAFFLLDYLGLKNKYMRKPTELSGGEKQRVAIARALANDPAIIIADEPTGSLDSENSKKVFELLMELAHQQNRAVIMVTHDPLLASQADRRIKLSDGILVTNSNSKINNFFDLIPDK